MDLEPPQGPDLDVEALAASLRADVADLDVYARVLTTVLADALPAGMVEVDRDRSLGDRLAGRPGTVTGLRVRFEQVTLELAAGRSGRPQARAVTTVGGVVISRRELTLAAWSQQLAEHLAVLAAQSQQANEALSRLLGL